MIIELLGHAPDNPTMRSFFKDVGWAEWTTTAQGDYWKPLNGTELQIDPSATTSPLAVVETPAVRDGLTIITPAVMVGGVHFNVRFYGATAAKMIEGKAQTDGEGNLLGLFERTSIKDDVEATLGRTTTLATKTAEGVKAGYEDATTKVRIFDPATIAIRNRVWA